MHDIHAAEARKALEVLLTRVHRRIHIAHPCSCSSLHPQHTALSLERLPRHGEDDTEPLEGAHYLFLQRFLQGAWKCHAQGRRRPARRALYCAHRIYDILLRHKQFVLVNFEAMVLHVDLRVGASKGANGRLGTQGLHVSPTEAHTRIGHTVNKLGRKRRLPVLSIYLEYLSPRGGIRQRKIKLPVETARAPQRRVHGIGPVCRPDAHDHAAFVKAWQNFS